MRSLFKYSSLILLAFSFQVCWAQIRNNTISYTAGTKGICGGTSFTAVDVIHGSTPPALAGGAGGYQYQWQKSSDLVTPFTFVPIPGANGPDYNPGTITASTTYQRVVTSGGLSSASNVEMIFVNAKVITGNVIFTKVGQKTEVTVPCGTPSYNPGQLDCTPRTVPDYGGGGDGDTYRYDWRFSTDGGLTYTDAKTTSGSSPGSVEKFNNPQAITKTTWFVRIITSGACVNQSDPIKFTFGVAGDAITAPATTSACGVSSYTPQTINGAALPAGYTYQWQSSPDNLNFTDIAGATQQNLSPSPISATTSYRRVSTSSGGCKNNSNSVTITVAPPFSANVVGAYQLINSAATPAPLTGDAVTAGADAVSYRWESSPDSLGTYSAASGAGTTKDYQPGPLTTTTYYRRVALSGSCTSTSNVVGVHVIGSVTPPPPPPPPDCASLGNPCPNGTPSADMGITLIHQPGTKTSGASYDYTLSASNFGPDDATEVVVRDTLPTNVTYFKATADKGSGSYDKATRVLTWTVGPLKKKATVQLILTVIPLNNDQIVTKLGIKALQCDPSPCNNTRRDTINDPLPIFDAKNIPDIITPNGDGKNDLWVIKTITDKGFSDNQVTIFDRWGNTVFSAKGYQNNWDGKGLSNGTYFYVLKINNSATTLNFKGYITLIR